MNEINSMIINEVINKKKKRGLIISTLFLLIGLALLAWGFYVTNQKMPKPVDMQPIAAKKESVEGKYIYLDMVDIPYIFAEKDNLLDKYYFAYDKDDHIYIIYLDEKTAKKLSDDNKKEEVKRIYGISKIISNDIRKIALDVFNDNDYDIYIASKDFENYFGKVYLDVTANYYEAGAQFTFGGILTMIGLLCFFGQSLTKKRIKKNINKYDQGEWAKIEAELNAPDIIFNKNVLFTKNYLVLLARNVDIIRYDDMIWAYFIHHRYNGVSTNRQAVVITKDKKLHVIEDFAAGNKKNKDRVIELLDLLPTKNKNILIGFTNENRLEANNRFEIKK